MRRRIVWMLIALLLTAGCLPECNARADTGGRMEAPPLFPIDPAEAMRMVEQADASPPRGHYTFQPKVCSLYMEEVFGKTMCETWYNLVDAVLAGEDTFACPDQRTYDWVMGQFPDKCFPVLTELITYAYDREHSVENGVASFQYTVPRDEAAARIREFADLIENILNETLADDDSDFEKVLALYEYFPAHYTYDDETAAYDQGYPEWLSSYRVFSAETGICQEFAVAYAYLLMQVGIDATNMMGDRAYDNAGHQWTYVRLYGHNYHIDPTYEIGHHALDYFLMDDAQREFEDAYAPSSYIITSNYAEDHPHPDYVADDDTFRPLWGSVFETLSRRDHILLCRKYDDRGSIAYYGFDYSGFQGGKEETRRAPRDPVRAAAEDRRDG